MMMNPAWCMALVSPLSPMTKAVPSGCCFCRNRAVAMAEVKMCSAPMSRPATFKRCARSPGVKMGLLVSTRNLASRSRSRPMKVRASGITARPRTSTPSMSIRKFLGALMAFLFRGSGA